MEKILVFAVSIILTICLLFMYCGIIHEYGQTVSKIASALDGGSR